MYQIIIVIHVLVGLAVIALVLMQQGRGADAGAAFGSGSAGSVFGAQGSASFLSRATAIFAFVFFSTSLALAVLGGQLGEGKSKDVIMDEPEIEQVVPDIDIPVIPDEEPLRVPSISEQKSLQESLSGKKLEEVEGQLPEEAKIQKSVEPETNLPVPTN
jgi:preprotein translocase subunit SecG